MLRPLLASSLTILTACGGQAQTPTGEPEKPELEQTQTAATNPSPKAASPSEANPSKAPPSKTAPSKPAPSKPTSDTQPTGLGVWMLAEASSPTLAGLAFEMDAKTAWEAAPRLRDAMRIRLEEQAYDTLLAQIPELGEGSSGGNRWFRGKSRSGSWPTLDGADWELRFGPRVGLSMITARFGAEQELRAAIAGWGAPDVDARWEFWLDEASHTRAAFTGCHTDSSGSSCSIEFMPYRSLEDTLELLLPGGKTLIGRELDELPFGHGLFEGDYHSFKLQPLPTSLWTPLQVQLDGGETGKVSAYRTALSYTYDAGSSSSYAKALRERIGETQAGADGCETGKVDGQPVRVCDMQMQHALVVGTWNDGAI